MYQSCMFYKHLNINRYEIVKINRSFKINKVLTTYCLHEISNLKLNFHLCKYISTL